jgi:hypothetical protein
MQHADLTSTYTNEFDRRGTLQQAEPIRGSARARKAKARGVLAVAIGTVLCIMPDAGGSGDIASTYTLKQYAYHSLNRDIKEYKCLAQLYGKESAWNPNARNGSHVGIPQGRSKYLLTATPYQQIDWGIKYNKNRHSSMCNAWAHWLKHKWH